MVESRDLDVLSAKVKSIRVKMFRVSMGPDSIGCQGRVSSHPYY